ncbi:MAG: DUF937 domain-containing protein [Pseudomonadota bacterium]
MSLLKMLMESQNGQGLSQLAQQFGLDEAQMGGLAGMIAPAISKGAKRRAEQPGGLEAMLGQMMGEREAQYLDNPAAAAQPEARQQGENFLEQIMGSREATNELGAAAAERSGVSQDLVSQIMPAIAAMMQGGMQRQMPDSSLQGMLQGLGGAQQSGGGGGLMGMLGGVLGGGKSDGGGSGGLDLGRLTQMLDADGDGSALDDILEKVMR